MNDLDSERSSLTIHTIARDCGYAMIAMGLVYLVGGESSLVLFVFGFAVSVVIGLLLFFAWSHLDYGDDDFN